LLRWCNVAVGLDQRFGGIRAPMIQNSGRRMPTMNVIGVAPDPDDLGNVRLLLRRVLGPPPGTDPDERAIELVCPHDMLFGTAAPHNIDLAPLRADS
jgi:hypothetical protein